MGGVARGWRDSAALIALSGARGSGRVLVQTRPAAGTFGNGVVFPGGVAERADGGERWLRLLARFGYSRADLAALHRPPASPAPPAALPLLLRPDPLLRHLSLRITAIRETFEELGVLVGSTTHKHQRTAGAGGHTATPITDFDIPHWQQRVSSDPLELEALCAALQCYPDVWALRWHSSWLSPTFLRKRFDTAFFLAHFSELPPLHPSTEVVKAEWAAPEELVSRAGLVLYPPQAYELLRLALRPPAPASAPAPAHAPPGPSLYHATVHAADGDVHVFPGDDLYPESIDYNRHTELRSEQPVAALRRAARVAHRFESVPAPSAPSAHTLVFKNYDGMDLVAVPMNVKFSA